MVGVTSGIEVDFFRPKGFTIGSDGKTKADGYWWLAYEWFNIYLVCPICNRLKGSRFPIEGVPAGPFADRDALAEEKPLLLDPCLDDPDHHLAFSENGSIGSLTHRGTITIQTLGLNREPLCQARARVIEHAKNIFEAALHKAKTRNSEIERLLDPKKEYTAAIRQCLASWMKEHSLAALPAYDLPDLSKRRRQLAVKQFREEQNVTDTYALGEQDKSRFLSRSRAIERIEIRNFRAIRNLTLTFSENDATGGSSRSKGMGSNASWLMLLGENAVGKTSILQAVALALVSETVRSEVVAQNQINIADWIHHGAEKGSVKIHLSGALHPVVMNFSRNASRFERNLDAPGVLVLAYGATRLLPRAADHGHRTFGTTRVANLFEPLNDAASWLSELSVESFDHVARSLKAPLQLQESACLMREGGRVFAKLHGRKVPLEELSDGYQSMLALITDIMRAAILSGWETLEQAEGIVLLDEVGAHLHPRWRMRVVESLRSTFPRIQMLASTHDPLCLRGLLDGEVVVLQRNGTQNIEAITDLPPIRGLRADQLLTSEFFGLHSTIDPDLEELFDEYYRLLAIARPKPGQSRRIDELKTELEPFRVLGDNRREQLMLETIDEFLANERLLAADRRKTVKEDVKRKLLDIWRKTPAAPVKVGGQQ
jgi:energy-coupling factor transporter ATP-binding protein EcfA2